MKTRWRSLANRLKQQGFSLVELSVVLTIVGITLGSALTIATNTTEADRTNTSNQRIEEVEAALARFLANNARLPCPADGTLAPSDSNFGKESINSASPPLTTCDNSSGHLLNSSDVWGGVVPTRTLNLSDDYMEDGWGWRFTYVVDDRFVNSNAYHTSTNNTDCDDTTTTNCFTYFDPSGGTITVNDAATGTPAQLTNQAVIVLISHGKNGHGAFVRQGSTTRIDRGYTSAGGENQAAEDENGSVTASFDNTFVQKDPVGLFDDVVSYETKPQLATAAGGITDTALCAAAANVLDSATDVTCTGSTGTSCSDMAYIIYQMCLEQE